VLHNIKFLLFLHIMWLAVKLHKSLEDCWLLNEYYICMIYEELRNFSNRTEK